MSNYNQIICPSCSHSFEASVTLSGQIKSELETQLKTEFGQKLKQEEQKLEQKIREQEQKLKDEFANKMEVLEKENRTKNLVEKEKIELEIQSKIALEIKTLQEKDEENQKRISEFGQKELELEKKSRELVDSNLESKKMLEKLEKLETEMAKELEIQLENKLKNQLEIERKLITNQIKEEENERTRLEIAEKNKQLADLRKSLEDANRKATLGSQQTQGDVQENDLKEILTSNFHTDSIEDVPVGVRGADLVHNVFSVFGKNCGKIIWESKRTQSWSESWVPKLKEDQANAKADIAIIATQVMPNGIKGHGIYKGIWLVQYNSTYILALTTAIRHFLETMNGLKNSQIGRDEKMEYLYDYLISSQFRGKIENIVEAFGSMKTDLDSEKRAMTKIWSKREKEITRVMDSTSRMYGDLQGIIGSKLEKIESLELDSCF